MNEKITNEEKKSFIALSAVIPGFCNGIFSSVFRNNLAFNKSSISENPLWLVYNDKNITFRISTTCLVSQYAEAVNIAGKRLLPVAIALKFPLVNFNEEFTIPELADVVFDFSSEGLQNLVQTNPGLVSVFKKLVAKQANVFYEIVNFENKNFEFKVYREEASDNAYIYLPEINDYVLLQNKRVAEYSYVFSALTRTHVAVVSAACYEQPSNFEELESGSDNWSLERHSDDELSDADFFNTAIVEDKLISEAIEAHKDAQSDSFVSCDLDLEDNDLSFICGSEAALSSELQTLMHCLIPMHYWDKAGLSEFVISIYSGTDDGESAYLCSDSLGWNDENSRLLDVLNNETASFMDILISGADHILQRNYPRGHSWEYNDGPYDRMSGYDKNALRFDITITRPSAHEQIIAKKTFKNMADSFSKQFIDEVFEFYNKLK